MIVIADAHVSGANADEFFAMLDWLAGTDHDVVFLGDIFDLWVGISHYENSHHLRFLEWCRRERQRRTVGYVEGNHEFYLDPDRADAFTWITDREWRDASGRVFAHGDQLNPDDVGHHRFHAVINHPLCRGFFRRVPGGPLIAGGIRRCLARKRNLAADLLPHDAIHAFAERHFDAGAAAVFIGHFHFRYTYRGASGGVLYALPDWQRGGTVAAVNNNTVTIRPWRDTR